MEPWYVVPKLDSFRGQMEDHAPAVIKQLLPMDVLEDLVAECNMTFRRRVFTPMVTMWIWLRQRMEEQGTCSDAVAKAFSWVLSDLATPPSSDDSSYCQARLRIPDELPERAAKRIGSETDGKSDYQVFGRPTYVLDGTTCRAADTEENQKAFPQHPNQKKGCGFPVVRITAIFSLATGVLRHLTMGSLAESEQALFHALWAMIEANAILLAERYFDSYQNLALLKLKGIDCVFRLRAGRRKPDFRQCKKRLGPGDGIFTWLKPKREKWKDQQEYDSAPDSIDVRIVRYTVKMPGFRSRDITLVTTLLDPVLYPAPDLVALYARRWGIELWFRHIKTTMGMHFINAQSPSMVRKEIWMYMLAYNVVRRKMHEASVCDDLPLERVSFKGTMQLVRSLADVLGSDLGLDNDRVYQTLLRGIAQRALTSRPNRSEPRALKRRKNKYTYLTRPRESYPEYSPKSKPTQVVIG